MVVRFQPVYLPGASYEHILSSISHLGMYGFMFFMPISGIIMGYYGGKGLPFFWTKIPGKEEPIKSIAGQAYNLHEKAGTCIKFSSHNNSGAR